MKKLANVMMALSLSAVCAVSMSAAALAADFDNTQDISVMSREDGSGTRGAFIELFGIEQKDADGNKVDMTTEEAAITNSTSVMMTSVAGDEYAIGYISLGSLDDSVKAVKIDGAEPTVDNVKAGDYKVVRPFNIVTKDDTLTDVDKDFIKFILSADGQQVIADNGYIAGETPPELKIQAVEAYQAINTNADIEIQTTDSTTGVSATQEGTYNIGMASRDLKDTETGVTATTIAQDGIAVIVNKENPIEELTSEQVLNIYTGEVTTWDELAE